MPTQLISLRRLQQQHLPDLSERWLYDLVRRNEIPAVRIGTRWLFDAEAVISALKARRRTTATAASAPACAGR